MIQKGLVNPHPWEVALLHMAIVETPRAACASGFGTDGMAVWVVGASDLPAPADGFGVGSGGATDRGATETPEVGPFSGALMTPGLTNRFVPEATPGSLPMMEVACFSKPVQK